jgi:hypothetical protein
MDSLVCRACAIQKGSFVDKICPLYEIRHKTWGRLKVCTIGINSSVCIYVNVIAIDKFKEWQETNTGTFMMGFRKTSEGIFIPDDVMTIIPMK